MGLWRELVASGKGVFANWAGRGWPRAETRGHQRLQEEKQKQKPKPKPRVYEKSSSRIGTHR